MASLMSLDSSTLTSCSKFRPVSFQNGVVKSNRRIVKCSSSREEEPRKNQAITRLVATGLALTISTSSANFAVAAEPSLKPVVANVAEQADRLLKDADKLTNEDSPPRFGPSRGGFAKEDAGRVAQKGGSGAIPDVQKSGSDLVGQARESIADKASQTKQKLDESVSSSQDTIQDKIEDAKSNIQGLFGQAQDKVKGGIDKVTDGSGNAGDSAKGLVGQAQDKLGSDIDTFKNAQLKAKGSGESGRLGNAGSNTVGGQLREGSKDAGDKVRGFFGQSKDMGSNIADNSGVGGSGGVDKSVTGNVKSGIENIKEGGDKVQGLFGKAQDNIKDSVDNIKEGAGNPVEKAKGLFGQAQDKVKGGMGNNPGEQVKGLVGDARNKVQGGLDDAGENAKNLVGSTKKMVRVR